MKLYPTPADLANWIASSHKGDRFVYHLGHLVHDRSYRVNLATSGTFTVIHNLPLGLIADAAWTAYEEGYVVLAQQRMGEDIYRYLAIRTKKYRQPPLIGRKEMNDGLLYSGS